MASQYVRLNRAQVSSTITPGELNQSIPTSQLPIRRCETYRHTLPESYVPPTDEPWSTGIFGCAEDTRSCWTGLFCPCVLFGRNIERLNGETRESTCSQPCIGHGICVGGGIALAAGSAFTCGIGDPNTAYVLCQAIYLTWLMGAYAYYFGDVRRQVQSAYHLQNSPCQPCMVHFCCLHCCALCQEHREMKARLPLETVTPATVTPATVITPPTVQAMTGRDNDESATTSDTTRNGTDSVTLEMQAL